MASSISNPFTNLGDEDCIHPEDFSYAEAQPSHITSRKQKFLSVQPSFNSAGRSLTDHRKSHSNIDDDKAASEWETVAPDDEFYEPNENSTRPIKRRRNFELVFHAQDIIGATNGTAVTQARNTIIGPPDISLPKLSSGRHRAQPAAHHSLHSSSSFYSNFDGDDGDTEEQLIDLDDCIVDRTNSQRRRATVGTDQTPNTELHELQAELMLGRSCSKASSSTNGDPFRYDRGMYSTFLQPAAERDVSSALHRAGTSHNSTIEAHHPFKVDQVDASMRNPIGNSSFYNPAAIRST